MTTIERITFNFTSGDPFTLQAPSKYLGNRLYLLDEALTIEYSIEFEALTNIDSNRSVSVTFLGANDAKAVISFQNITNKVKYQKHIYLSEEKTGVDSWQLQAILLNVSAIHITFSTGRSFSDIGSFYNLEMLSLLKDNSGGFTTFGGVEQCECPKNFTGNSCEICANGKFTDYLLMLMNYSDPILLNLFTFLI